MAEAEDELPPARSVVPLLRACVLPLSHSSSSSLSFPSSPSFTLSVWRPGQEVVELMQEGVGLQMYNLAASHGRYVYITVNSFFRHGNIFGQ